MKYAKLLEQYLLSNKETYLNEGRKVLKRKYKDRGKIRVNENARLRNEIIMSVGNKTVSLDELKNMFSQIGESRGRNVNGKDWYRKNKRYFKESNGMYKLSSVGKRLYHTLLEKEYNNK